MLVASSTRALLLLVVSGLFLTGCVTMPGTLPATDHFNQTYRTRAIPNTPDVFIRPFINLYKRMSYESVWIELQKEVGLAEMQFNVSVTLIDDSGKPFQSAQVRDTTLDFVHVFLDSYSVPDQKFNPVDLTTNAFTLGMSLELASTVACEPTDFEVQLTGTDRDDFDLIVPRAILQGFLAKLKKSGERGIDGECIDELL